tara:strand:+ start:75 stop:278 length:204 start_codon:yes stop_codon:yes gene_type:complete
LGLPARDDGEYLQSAPQARHREQIGRALLHLTFARKHVSQDARNLEYRGLELSLFAGPYIPALVVEN